MNETNLPTPSDEGTTERVQFSMAPTTVWRDPTLSDLAVRVYLEIDYRAGRSGEAHVGAKRLASDLSKSERTVKRAISELKSAGWVIVKRTPRTSIYRVVNPSRVPVEQMQEQTPRSARSVPSEVPDLSLRNNKSLRTRETPPKPPSRERTAQRPPAAAGGGGRERSKEFVSHLPDHLRPNLTSTLDDLLEQASSNGWHVGQVAEQIHSDLYRGNYGPGAVIARLRSIAHQPPPEQPTPKPEWCGECDERTRLVEEANGAQRCLRCHPIRTGAEIFMALADQIDPETEAAAEIEPAPPRLITRVYTDEMLLADLFAVALPRHLRPAESDTELRAQIEQLMEGIHHQSWTPRSLALYVSDQLAAAADPTPQMMVDTLRAAVQIHYRDATSKESAA